MMKISKQTRNIIAYIVGSTIVLFGTIVLVAFATGWQYNFTTGELHDTGLMILSSEPANAEITIDSTPLKQRTPYRYTSILPGEYEVNYRLDGYRPWVKQSHVEAEQVTFNDYAWLIPETVPVRPRYGDRAILAASQSFDRHRTILVEQPPTAAGQPPAAPRLLVTSDWAREPAILYAPSVAPLNATTPAPTQVASFNSLQLSADDSMLLVRQTLVNGTSQYLIMPTATSDNLRITNISTETGLQPDWLSWGPTGGNELWIKSEGTLTRWLVNERKLEPANIQNVIAATWSLDKLITINQPAATNPTPNLARVEVRDNNSLNSPEDLGNIMFSSGYKMQYFHDIDHDYVGILPATGTQLTVTRDIFVNKANRVTSLVGKNVQNFTVNSAGNHLVLDESDRLVSIDLERYQRSHWQASLSGLQHWEWINDQHLILETNGQLRIIDYDGQNNELIASTIVPGSPIIFGDNKSILSFTKSADPAATTTPQSLSHFFLMPDKILE